MPVEIINEESAGALELKLNEFLESLSEAEPVISISLSESMAYDTDNNEWRSFTSLVYYGDANDEFEPKPQGGTW